MARKVMVVDDSRTVRQQAGYEVVEAVDGIDGRERIASCPDLAMVICDVTMPRMDGLQMVEHVRNERKNDGLPILMLTTEGQPALIARAKAAGARGWIVKPFRPELLVAAVRKLAGAT